MIADGHEFEKIHDILKLVDNLKNYFPAIGELNDDVAILNRYYITSRYPGGAVEIFSMDEARKAVEIAKSVKKFVLDQVFDS